MNNKVKKILIGISIILSLGISFNTISLANTNNVTGDKIINDFPDDTDEVNLDIIDSESLISDDMKSLEDGLKLIKKEPEITKNYDLICPFLAKNGNEGIEMFADGKMIDFAQYNNVKPEIVEGRTLIPIRALSECLGADVTWDPDKRIVKVVMDDKVIELKIDSKDITINGVVKTIDVPATIKNGRTVVPVRVISEEYGKKVEWHPYSKYLNVIGIY